MHSQLSLAGDGSILTGFQLEKVPRRDFSVCSGTENCIYSMLLSRHAKSPNVHYSSGKLKAMIIAQKTSAGFFLSNNVFTTKVKAVINQHIIKTKPSRD